MSAELFGFLAQLVGSQEHALPHDFSRFEFHRGAGRDDDVFFGLVRIPADPGFGEPDLKNAKIPQLDIPPVGEGVGNEVEGLLNHRKNFLLCDACVFADLHNQIPFCQIRHGGFL
jgi:hypothetical protein